MPRTKSIEIMTLEFLINRLEPHHPQKEEITNHLGKLTAGYFGETTSDHYLRYLNEKSLHDVRLHDGIQSFQIDSLLPTQNYLVILEVKNYKGELVFDFDNHRLLRNSEGRTDLFPDPFIQVELQKFQLQRWIKKLRFPPIPIYSFIVIANLNASLSFIGKNDEKKKRVLLAKQLPPLLTDFMDNYKGTKVWNDDQLKSFEAQVQAGYTPYKTNVLKQFGVSRNDLTSGVQCPKCQTFGMIRRRDHWSCNNCGRKSKEAHLQLLKEYQLLIGNEITNAEFRKFAGIETGYTLRKLLNECCSPNFGRTRNRKYYIELDI